MKLNARLQGFYNGFQQLKSEGFKVEAVSPQAAIYLTVQFDLKGFKKENGDTLETTKDITRFLLDEAKLAIVPFYAFGASDSSTWYRLSVGTCKLSDVEGIIGNLRTALKTLK